MPGDFTRAGDGCHLDFILLKAAVPAISTSGGEQAEVAFLAGSQQLAPDAGSEAGSEQEVAWWQAWTHCCFVTLTQRPDVPSYTLSPLPGEECAEGLHGTVAG